MYSFFGYLPHILRVSSPFILRLRGNKNYDGGIHSRDNLYYSKRFVAVFNNLCLTVKNSSNFLTEAKDFRVNFYR